MENLSDKLCHQDGFFGFVTPDDLRPNWKSKGLKRARGILRVSGKGGAFVSPVVQVFGRVARNAFVAHPTEGLLRIRPRANGLAVEVHPVPVVDALFEQ